MQFLIILYKYGGGTRKSHPMREKFRESACAMILELLIFPGMNCGKFMILSIGSCIRRSLKKRKGTPKTIYKI